MAEEKNFENKVKKFLEDHDCWFVKYWGGGAFTKAGIPDLLCCVGGHFLAIELKASNGRPSELQRYNLNEIWGSGGYALLLYPNEFEDFKLLVLALLEGNTDLAREYESKINGDKL